MITKLYKSHDYHKIQTNDKRLVDENHIKCYVSQQKGFNKYINKNEIKNNISKFKVIAFDGTYGANSGFGNLFIAYPNEVYFKTYISFEINTEQETKSLILYYR